MYLLSSLTLGILFLFKASSLAQSLPYLYQDSGDDDEAVINRIASLAAAVREQFPRQKSPGRIPEYNPNYDTPAGNFGEFNDELPREYFASLPRQFAYKPDDVRFYMSPEQFPKNPPSSLNDLNKADPIIPKTRQAKQDKVVKENNLGNFEYIPVQGESPSLPNQQQTESLPLPLADETTNSLFMKKNQVKEMEPAEHAQNLIAGPSNFMSSDHSIQNPNHLSKPVENDTFSYHDIYYIGLIAGCSAAVVIALVGAGIFWYRIHQRVKAAAEVDYPAYGVTGPSKDISPSGGDRKLAQSAQMYHYQHQKQQMAALQKGALQTDHPGAASDIESEDDNEDDNDYTVYECPGLAPAGEMEVKNPLFEEESTPTTPHVKPEEK